MSGSPWAFLSVACGRGLEFEDVYHLYQIVALHLHRLRGRCRFFDQRSILLRNFIHMRDGQADLIDALTLFLAGNGNFLDHVADLADAADHVTHGGAGLADQIGAGAHFLHRTVDERFDLFGGGR